ncbi:Nucleolar GTP-binding protein 1, partial [Rhizoclosmatium hyalinum]
ERPVSIPEGALQRAKYDKMDPNRRKLEVDLEVEGGGAGVFNVDLKKLYQFKNDEWKYDKIPEIMDGKNVADFFDEDIEARLEELEREEERLEREGFYDEEEVEMDDSDEEALKLAAKEVEKKRDLLMRESRMKKSKNRAILPAKFKKRSAADMTAAFAARGIDIEERARSLTRKRTRSESRAADTNDRMSLAREQSLAAKRHKGVSQSRDRSTMGLKSAESRSISQKVLQFAQRPMNANAKASESDRKILTKMPKHLFSGKRGNGSASHR